MRFKLTLQVESQLSGREIPINYQYELSSVIYNIISKGDGQYSQKLHDEGYCSNIKRFKLFTFSNLIVPQYGIKKETERLVIKSDEVYWYLSFIPEEGMQKFIQGVFTEQSFRVADQISGVWFKIREVQLLPDLEYRPEMEFETLSSICVTKRLPDGRKAHLSPKDDTYEEGLLTGLIERYEAINGKEYDGERYCQLKVLNDPKSVLVRIKSGTSSETKIRGYRYRFTLSLPQPLMSIAYDGGLGEKGSMGFGMIKVKE